MRAGTWGLLGFATFWLAFIAFWTVRALGVFFNGGQVHWENAIFAAFSTPFWLVGFGMLGGVLARTRSAPRLPRRLDPVHGISLPHGAVAENDDRLGGPACPRRRLASQKR